MDDEVLDDDSDFEVSFDALPKAAKQAFHSNVSFLFDAFLDDIEMLGEPDSDFACTSMSAGLPSRYLERCDCLFAKDFLVAFLSAADRFRNAQRPRCVAEELAMAMIVNNSVAWLTDMSDYDDETVVTAAEALKDHHSDIVEDCDYEYLFDPEMDGMEYVQELGVANLRFSDWFKPFREGEPVHPLLAANVEH